MVPLHIVLHHVAPTATAVDLVRVQVLQVEGLGVPVTGCQVVLEGIGGHLGRGGRYGVRVELMLRNDRAAIVERRDGDDLDQVVRLTFEAISRRLAGPP